MKTTLPKEVVMRNRYKNNKNKSGYIGVYYKKDVNKWVAAITINKKRIYIGAYDTPEEASEAYQEKAKEMGVVRKNEITEKEKYLLTKEYQKQWREDHKEEYKLYWKERFQRIYPEKRQEISEKTKLKKQEIKQDIMLEYGGKCQCCGENILEFLTIDIIEKGGRELHEKIGYGDQFYRWLKKNGYPKDNFQCLCMNCNFAKGMYGKCPHQLEKDREDNNDTSN